MTLRYGPAVKHYGLQHIESQFAGVKLQKGHSHETKRPKPVVSFEMWGIEVLVTDKVAANHVYELTGIGKDASEVEPYLHRILFLALEQQPEYLEERLKKEFDRGVVEGRRQKVKEFRKVLSD